MTFEISKLPPYFFNDKERMRRLEKLQNEYLEGISNKDSYELLEWITNRSQFCYKCNTQFYSNIGLVSHGCLK